MCLWVLVLEGNESVRREIGWVYVRKDARVLGGEGDVRE